MEKLFGTKSRGGCRKLHDELKENQKNLEDIKSKMKIAWEDESGSDRFNAAWNSLRQQCEARSSIVMKLHEMIAACEEIEINDRNTEHVSLGSIIEFADLSDPENKVSILEIVGFNEGDKGCVSYQAPLAIAMMGKVIGDIITFETPLGSRTIQILGLHSEWPKAEVEG